MPILFYRRPTISTSRALVGEQQDPELQRQRARRPDGSQRRQQVELRFQAIPQRSGIGLLTLNSKKIKITDKNSLSMISLAIVDIRNMYLNYTSYTQLNSLFSEAAGRNVSQNMSSSINIR